VEIPVSEFKAKCLALLNQVAQSRETLIITKHGRQIVKVIPYQKERDHVEKPLKDAATYIGDIVSPIEEIWEFDE